MSPSLHNRYIFTSKSCKFEPNFPSLHSKKFDPILDDIHKNSPLSNNNNDVIMIASFSTTVLMVCWLVGLLELRTTLILWVFFGLLLPIYKKYRKPRGERLFNSLIDYLNNNRSTYESILKEVGFSFSFSLSFHNNEIEGHVEFAQYEDMIQSGPLNTEDSRLDNSFESTNRI